MNRRRSPASTGGVPGLKPALLTAAAFRQTLLKLSQRLTRQEREFAVIALNILEYDTVRTSLGEAAAEQLNNLGRDLCLANIRGADRLCNPQPGHFLIVMPDSSEQSAAAAVDRLTRLIADAKTHFKHTQLRASCSSRAAYCQLSGCDPEAMLLEVGYRFDEPDNLEYIHQPSASGSPTGFRGAFSSWVSRYDNLQPQRETVINEYLIQTRLTAADIWSGQPVQIKVTRLASGREFDEATLDLILRRTRVLQTVDHPGIAATTDFHIKDKQQLYLVGKLQSAPSLQSFIASPSQVTQPQLLDWGTQMCNSLIYLQTVMPPVIPPALSPNLFIVDKATRLILVDYEIPYLFPLWHHAAAVSSEEMQAVAQGRPIAAYNPIIRSFASVMASIARASRQCDKRLTDMLNRLQEDALPAELNTIYKVRSALKELSEPPKIDER